MVKSSIQVVVRTRPTADFVHDAIRIKDDEGTISVHLNRNNHAAGQTSGGPNNLLEDWSFKFSRVLHNESQDVVYDCTCRDMVSSTIKGYNGTLMAYGQTGAGKSFTMGNGTYNYKYRGIAPRAISQVFREIAGRPETDVVVRVSYLEIYNETFRDLLWESESSAPSAALLLPDMSIRDDGNGNVFMKGLSKIEVASEEHALNLLFEGDSHRAVGEHSHNNKSSRSHTIFTIHLETRSRVESAERIVVSKLNLVDLAGSERVAKTDSRGQTLQEALFINRSLSFLEQVVMALSEKNRDHIPFRSSKLTHVLRDSLGGNSITRLIANIWPEARHLEETISTLKFATRMMRLTTDATINVDLDPVLLLKKYERQIQMLKQELAMHDTLSERRGRVQYDQFTPEQQNELRQQVHQYINGDSTELECTNLYQIHELFRQFRLICIGSRSAQPISTGAEQGAVAAAANTSSAAPANSAVPSSAASELVGDIDDSVGGFSVGGQASSQARPASVDDGFISRAGSPIRPYSFTPTPASAGAPPAGSAMPDVQENHLEQWRATLGSDLNQQYSSQIDQWRQKRADLKVQSLTVNASKHSIDQLADKLGQARQVRLERLDVEENASSDQLIIDEEEYAIIRELKAAKAAYQAAFDQRLAIQNEIAVLKATADQTKVRLANEFLIWCDQHNYKTKQAGDALDCGELFDKVETERIMSTDPDSLSYYNAKKSVRHSVKGKRGKRSTGAPASCWPAGRPPARRRDPTPDTYDAGPEAIEARRGQDDLHAEVWASSAHSTRGSVAALDHSSGSCGIRGSTLAHGP